MKKAGGVYGMQHDVSDATFKTYKQWGMVSLKKLDNASKRESCFKRWVRILFKRKVCKWTTL